MNKNKMVLKQQKFWGSINFFFKWRAVNFLSREVQEQLAAFVLMIKEGMHDVADIQ